MGRRVVFTFLLAFAVLSIAAPRAHAEAQANIFEKTTMAWSEFDPSTAAAGMAGASGAVLWNEGANFWANPALLGYAKGAHYEYMSTSFADGVYKQRAQQLALGGGGFGVASVGQPFHGFGKLERESGPFWFNSAYGPLDPWTYLERSRAWGVGVSVAGLANAFARLTGSEAPAILQHVDVAGGYLEKVMQANMLFPGFPAEQVTSHDVGVLARVGTKLAGGRILPPLQLDAAYGWSRKNGDGGHGSMAPLMTYTRHAFAAHGALPLPERLRSTTPAWLASSLGPLVGLGVAVDLEHDTGVDSPKWYQDVHRYGAELALTRLVAVRYGHFESASHSTGDTWGVALTLPYRDVAGVRWSHASVPLNPNAEAPDRHYDTWSAWVDPLALMRAMR